MGVKKSLKVGVRKVESASQSNFLFMLKKQFRIPKDAPRQKATIQAGTSLFSLFASPNALEYDRFAVIASKRVDKRAVVRNMAKRKIRSCIEQSLSRFKPGFDITLVCKKPLLDADQTVLCSQLTSIWQKKGLFL